MEAGRELDALVAEKVMGEPRPTGNVPDGVLAGVITSSSDGGNWIGTTTGYTAGDEPVWLPKPYSTEISPAFELVEKVRELVSLEVEFELCANEDGSWDACFGIEDFVCADAAPLVICLAALKAVGCSLEEEKS